MEEAKNEIIMSENSIATDFENSNRNMYSTIKNDGTIESKKKIYNALNNTSETLSDHVGKVINLRDFIAHKAIYENDETGEITEDTRCILIADDGTSYSTISKGIASAIQQIFGIFGTPDLWSQPLPIKIIEKKSRKGYKYLTIEVVE